MFRSEILSSLQRITGIVRRRTAPRAGSSIPPLATARINGLSAVPLCRNQTRTGEAPDRLPFGRVPAAPIRSRRTAFMKMAAGRPPFERTAREGKA